MIKNLVFDFGGVLLTEDYNWDNSDEIKNLLKVDEERLMNGWTHAWPEARNGKINEEKFFEIFLINSIGKQDKSLTTALKKIYRSKVEALPAFSILESLKNKYKIFALTNITKDWLNYKIKRFSLDKLFDLIISSCDEGIAKPNKEIFLALIKKTQINPKESLFIDNMEKNIIPAQELGFEVCLYTDLENLKQRMNDLGINYE